MSEPHVTLLIGPGGGGAVTEEEMFSSHGEVADSALRTDRQPSAVTVSALSGTIAALSAALRQAIGAPYVIRMPHEAAHLAAQVEAAAVEFGGCFEVLAAWLEQNTPGLDATSFKARAAGLSAAITHQAIASLGTQAGTDFPSTSAEVAREIAQHLERLGYEVTEITVPGVDDASTSVQMSVDLGAGRVLHIGEGLFGWEAFIWSETADQPPVCGVEVTVESDHDPRRIAELCLEGQGLPCPAHPQK